MVVSYSVPFKQKIFLFTDSAHPHTLDTTSTSPPPSKHHPHNRGCSPSRHSRHTTRHTYSRSISRNRHVICTRYHLTSHLAFAGIFSWTKMVAIHLTQMPFALFIRKFSRRETPRVLLLPIHHSSLFHSQNLRCLSPKTTSWCP